MVLDKPALTHRPPSGAGLSQDNTLYTHPWLVGWVPWRPGMRYDVRITVRMKKGSIRSKDDVLLTATKSIIAPQNAPVFDSAWKKYKSIVLSETAGLERKVGTGGSIAPLLPG